MVISSNLDTSPSQRGVSRDMGKFRAFCFQKPGRRILLWMLYGAVIAPDVSSGWAHSLGNHLRRSDWGDSDGAPIRGIGRPYTYFSM